MEAGIPATSPEEILSNQIPPLMALQEGYSCRLLPTALEIRRSASAMNWERLWPEVEGIPSRNNTRSAVVRITTTEAAFLIEETVVLLASRRTEGDDSQSIPKLVPACLG